MTLKEGGKRSTVHKRLTKLDVVFILPNDPNDLKLYIAAGRFTVETEERLSNDPKPQTLT